MASCEGSISAGWLGELQAVKAPLLLERRGRGELFRWKHVAGKGRTEWGPSTQGCRGEAVMLLAGAHREGDWELVRDLIL